MPQFLVERLRALRAASKTGYPWKENLMSESKLIAGVLHIRRQCYRCKEMFWVQPTRYKQVICGSCYDSVPSPCDTRAGGGKQVIHKDTHSGG